MTKILVKIIFVLFIAAIVLPMLFLLLFVIGEVMINISTEQENHGILAQFSYLVAALWIFDLVLLIMTLAMKELAVYGGVFDQPSGGEELLGEEFNELINRS